MPPRTAPTLAALISTAILTACTPVAQPTLTPTSSPTYLCTPEAGGAALPCSSVEAEQAEKRDALYAEAEGVYRRFWVELNRLSGEPDPQVTPVLAETTADQFRRFVETSFEPGRFNLRVSGKADLVRLDRLPGLSMSGSTVALLACIDSRGATFEGGTNTKPSPGSVFEMRVYLGPKDDFLKIIDSESRDVAEC